jgi:hypothetical protein
MSRLDAGKVVGRLEALRKYVGEAPERLSGCFREVKMDAVWRVLVGNGFNQIPRGQLQAIAG